MKALANLLNHGTIRIAAVVLLIVIGVLNLSLGADYAANLSPFTTYSHQSPAFSLISLFSTSAGCDATAAFLIIAGVLMMLVPLLVYKNLAQNTGNMRLANICFFLTIALMLNSLSAGAIAAIIFTPYNQFVGFFGLTINNSVSSTYKGQLYFALADSVITFILGWPCAVYLFLATCLKLYSLQGQASNAGGANTVQMQENRSEVPPVIQDGSSIQEPSTGYQPQGSPGGPQFQVNPGYPPNQVQFPQINPSFQVQMQVGAQGGF